MDAKGLSSQSSSTTATCYLLRLPLEIRQQIYGYLLPRTTRLKRPRREPGKEIAWELGNTAILTLNHQIHVETASLLYGGSNIFVLEVNYDGTRFQFQRLMRSGLIPKQTPLFLDKVTKPNLRFLKNVIVNVNHVDSYTGMIKYNCGGRGLTNGIKLQVKKLVDVLKIAEELSLVQVHLVDHKRDARGSQQALEPFAELNNMSKHITVTGAETADFIEKLRQTRQQSTLNEHSEGHDNNRHKKVTLLPDLALANFYEDTHATSKELQGF